MMFDQLSNSKLHITLFLLLSYLCNITNTYSENSKRIETIYGTEVITEPVLIDLINDKYMQRLKEINQYGIDYYVYKAEKYTRYDHSLGVFFLVRLYGGSLKEQIAALLHDVSHTTFSHVGDFLFNKVNTKDSYQDDIHYSFIKQSSLKDVLKKHGYKIKDILHKNKDFTCLESDLPNICADRLEYNLFGGVLQGLINLSDIKVILNDLKFKNNIWYFKNAQYAKLFADVSLYLSTNRWANHDTAVINVLATNVLKSALKLNIIDHDDICYGRDHDVWSKLVLSNDDLIKVGINKLLNFKDYYRVDYNDFDIFLKLKCRIIDPFVKVNNSFLRLSEIDKEFKKEFIKVKDLISKGFYIKFI